MSAAAWRHDEGQQAITGIEYAVRPRGDATSASCVHKYANCDAVIKLRPNHSVCWAKPTLDSCGAESIDLRSHR